MTQKSPPLALTSDALDRLMPMHLHLGPTGHIEKVGPTLAKLRPGLVGMRFLEMFELRRPRKVSVVEDLLTVQGSKLQLQFREEPRTRFTGVGMPCPGGMGQILNLSFGIWVVDAVADYHLSSIDFAPTDLTIEMLYLVEAKSAAMQESLNLNLRLQGAKIAAEEQAYTDTLSGLKNRRAMDHIMARLLETNESFGLMQLDLDFFKDVNDTMGHAAGDHVLQHVAKILVAETRDEDTVARVGGDEFVLIFRGLTKISRLTDIAERIIKRLEQPIPYQDKTCRISGSIGITLSNAGRDDTCDQLLKDADVALYASKNKGRACATVFEASLIAASGGSTELTEVTALPETQ